MLTDTTALDHDFGITNCPPNVELAAEKLMLICGLDYFQCKSHVPQAMSASWCLRTKHQISSKN